MAGGRMDIMAGRAYVELFVKNNRLIKGLQDARQRMSQFGGDIMSLGRQLVAISAAAVIPMAFSIKKFAEFDDAMREVKAVTQASESAFQMLTEKAKALGAATSFTAVEVAALMAELGRAGFSPDQVNEMTGAVLNLARATKTDATLASGIMAASIRQFSMSAGDATRVSDGLTTAANKTFNTVEQLGEALNYAGPVAADFNMSFEDTLAILGGLGNMGIHASNAGTALRRLLTITGAEGSKLAGIFGVQFINSAGNVRPLVDVLGEVNTATEHLGTAARAQKFNEAFGLLGITSASAIGHTAGDVKKLAEEIKNAGGSAAEAAAQMDAGLGGAFRIFLSALEGVQIALGGAIESELTSITKAGTEMLGVTIKIVNENRDAVITFAKWALGIGAVGAALIAVGLSATFVSIAIGGLLSIFSGLLGLFLLLTSPITLVLAAVVGLTYYFAQLGAKMGVFDGIASAAMATFVKLKTSVMQTFGGIRDAIGSGDLALAGQIAFTGLKLVAMQAMDAIASSIGGTWGKAIGDITSKILDGDFAGVWNTVVLEMSAVWTTFSNEIVNIFAAAGNGIIAAFRTVESKLKSIVDSISDYMLKDAEEGGAFGALVFTTSDVALLKEKRREERLSREYAKLGLDSSGGTIGKDTPIESDGILDSATAAINAAVERTRIDKAAAVQALNAAVDTGDQAVNEGIAKLQKELDQMRFKAKLQLENANRQPADPNIPGADGAGAGAKGGSGFASGTSSASFSAAGLIALGQGGSESPVVRETRAVRKAIEKAAALAKIDTDMQIEATLKAGGFGLGA